MTKDEKINRFLAEWLGEHYHSYLTYYGFFEVWQKAKEDPDWPEFIKKHGLPIAVYSNVKDLRKEQNPIRWEYNYINTDLITPDGAFQRAWAKFKGFKYYPAA